MSNQFDNAKLSARERAQYILTHNETPEQTEEHLRQEAAAQSLQRQHEELQMQRRQAREHLLQLPALQQIIATINHTLTSAPLPLPYEVSGPQLSPDPDEKAAEDNDRGLAYHYTATETSEEVGEYGPYMCSYRVERVDRYGLKWTITHLGTIEIKPTLHPSPDLKTTFVDIGTLVGFTLHCNLYIHSDERDKFRLSDYNQANPLRSTFLEIPLQPDTKAIVHCLEAALENWVWNYTLYQELNPPRPPLPKRWWQKLFKP